MKSVIQKAVDSDIPYPRNGHSCVFWNEKLWLFAGRIKKMSEDKRRSYTNSLVSCEILSNSSNKIAVNATEIATTGSIPPPVHCHVSFCNEEKNLMYVIGGSGYDGYLDSVYKLDLKSLKWKKSKVKFKYPRHGHCHTRIKDNVYIFGGHYTTYSKHEGSSREFYNEFLVFNLKTESLHKLETDTTTIHPKGRSWGNIFGYKNSLFVLSGFSMKKRCEIYYDDFFRFDLETLKWTPVKQSGTIPHKRNRASLTRIDPETFIYYGGNFYNGREDIWFEEVFKLSVVDEGEVKWERLKGRVRKSSHHIHHFFEVVDKKFILTYGGEVKRKRPKQCYVMELLH